MSEAVAEFPKVAVDRQPMFGLVIRIAVSIGILAWLGSRVDWNHVADAFRELRWNWWLTALGLYVLCQLLCSVRWMWLSRPLGFSKSLTRFTGLYFVGMFFNLFLPTSVGGDAVRAVYLANGTGKRMAALFSVLLDRASGLIVLIGLACIAAAFCPVELPMQLLLTTWAVGAAAIMGLSSLPLLVRAGTRQRNEKIRAMAEMLASYRGNLPMIAGTTLVSIIVQVLNAVLVMFIGWALRLEVPPVYYALAAPMVTLFTLIPISLNGMGLREGGMVLFLAPAGVASGHAVTLAFLWFLVQTTASVFGAVVYLFGRFTPMEEKCDRSIIDHHSTEGRTSERRAAA
jgi:uncharacterized membrane protein YbhN (UPF0104 family)